jgi:hypothetical protein
MNATPLDVARHQAAAREKAALEAAAKALDSMALVEVRSVGDMTEPQFRKHMHLRHPGTKIDYRDHAIEHKDNPDEFDHIHLSKPPL